MLKLIYLHLVDLAVEVLVFQIFLHPYNHSQEVKKSAKMLMLVIY